MNHVLEDFVVKESQPGMGLGLYAARNFTSGDYLIDYTGTKIPTKGADRLRTRYLFEIDDDWTIDGEDESNTARYINHSCDPNTEADVVEQRILISALRDIKKGEELTIDYGEEYFDEFIRPEGCQCGSSNCRKPAGVVSRK